MRRASATEGAVTPSRTYADERSIIERSRPACAPVCSLFTGTAPPVAAHTLKLVLCTLHSFGGSSGACFPSIRLVASRCELTTRTVQRAMSGLEARALITRRPVYDDSGRQRSNRLEFDFEALAATAPDPETTRTTSDVRELEGRQIVRGGVTNCQGEGDTGVRGGVTPVSPLYPPYTQKNKAAAGGARTDDRAQRAPDGAPSDHDAAAADAPLRGEGEEPAERSDDAPTEPPTQIPTEPAADDADASHATEESVAVASASTTRHGVAAGVADAVDPRDDGRDTAALRGPADELPGSRGAAARGDERTGHDANEAQRAANAVSALVDLGVDREAAAGLVRLHGAAVVGERAEVARRNIAHRAAKGGPYANPAGYARKCVEHGYALLPELAAADAASRRNGARTEARLEEQARRERERDEAAREARAASEVDAARCAFLATMTPEQRSALRDRSAAAAAEGMRMWSPSWSDADPLTGSRFLRAAMAAEIDEAMHSAECVGAST